MDGATASAEACGAKAEAMPFMLGTTAMGFAKSSTHPTICRFVTRIGEFIEADQSDLAYPAPLQNYFCFSELLLAA
jgi:hypothetical protein